MSTNTRHQAWKRNPDIRGKEGGIIIILTPLTNIPCKRSNRCQKPNMMFFIPPVLAQKIFIRSPGSALFHQSNVNIKLNTQLKERPWHGASLLKLVDNC